MYVKENMKEEDYKDLAKLMRDLMVRWKNNEGKIVKEISMPDMIDIVCRCWLRSKYEIIDIYWKQLKEDPDPVVSAKIRSVIDLDIKIVDKLSGTEGFTSTELQSIIDSYIKSVPVINLYKQEEN